MRRPLVLLATLLVLATYASANAPPAPPAPDQSQPQNVVESLFTAARWGHFVYLGQLCDPKQQNDGDTDCLCALSPAYTPHQCAADSNNRLTPKDYTEYFSKGGVQGEPRIEGDRAEVDILFGPDGTRKETMNLVKRGELWYLSSF